MDFQNVLRTTVLLTVITLSSSSYVWFVKSFAGNEAQIPIEKICPRFCEKIEEMKDDEAFSFVSLIIWLRENQRIMNVSIEDLKIYAASLFQNNFNANVYYIGKALPVIVTTVSVNYVENIASYEFVEYVSNGNEWIYPPHWM